MSSASDKRIEELKLRAVVKNRLRDLTMRDGWTEVKKIVSEYIAKYEKMSTNRTLKDENRVRALDMKRAVIEVFDEIDKRIEMGNSAENTLQKESVD